jgi:hypothetical protein
MAGLFGRRVVRRFEGHAPVALHPVTAQVVAVGHVDLTVRMQLGRVEERVERQHRLVDARPLVSKSTFGSVVSVQLGGMSCVPVEMQS